MNKKRREPREPQKRGTTPTRDDVLAYLSQHPAATKRDLARHFDIKGSDKIALKRLLHDLMDEGDVKRGRGKTMTRTGDLPEVTVVEIVERDTDGEMLCRPTQWDSDAKPPHIILAPGADGAVEGRALGIGERFLARLKRAGDGYEARIIKRLGAAATKTLGVFRKLGRHGRIEPVDKKARHDFVVSEGDTGGALDGELVAAEPVPGPRMGQPRARITERLGSMSESKTISLIAIHAHGIPDHFPQNVVDEAERAKPAALEDGRVDLRRIPLVTIDPPDARDHDDAVWAEADADPANKGGFNAIVAIADVAFYVRPNSPLDREAVKRGNSCYFPDRVVPMLPEHLSADLCSLKEKQDRAILACHMKFDAGGKLKSHRFERALMRSAASLSYAEVQEALDGHPNDKTGPLLAPILKPLEACYRALVKARNKRSPLDLDLPERKIELGPDGRVKSIGVRERYDAHRLIEEFMIQANVAAAEALEAKRTPLVFRIHAPPSPEKLLALGDFLGTLNIPLTKGQAITTAMLNRILAAAKDTPNADLINVVMLRSQSQAEYSPDNIGHFGLALHRYAHFTSPIRRYADLIVHRALIRAYKLGAGGLNDAEVDRLSETAQDISAFERRAMAAERDSTDRYVAAFMSDRVGAEFYGKISGVTRFGLFVRLDETGADGLIPVRSLGQEFFKHDERAHALVGERSGLTFRLGEKMRVRLAEATPLTGGLRFELVEGGKAGTPSRDRRGPKKDFKRGGRRR
ncbi:MAG: ribonuclease R [Parvibaculum sp.]|uniref:ribonuclease R n=1 Tax=Parvibaculum sp. TaxID=2024848 RepID=UPI0025E568C0|nr:ribonuclease R [Parvibaculum sp.]MCE9648749.1 ribonuclease R [Parvibaculum sp.]